MCNLRQAQSEINERETAMLEIDGIAVPETPIKPELSPGTEKAEKLHLLCDYLRYRQRLPFSAYLGDKKTRDEFNNGRKASPVRFNPPLFNHIRGALYEHLVRSDQNFAHLKSLDDYIVPLVLQIYPDELTAVLAPDVPIRNVQSSKGVLEERANGNQKELGRIYTAFEHGAYTIRYARNMGEERGETPFFAKGVIKVSPPNGQSYLNFTIKYNARPNTPIDIEGRIYIISNSLVFIGVEVADTIAFFMVMSHDFKDKRHGGLVMRRHHESDQKRYFTSKAMIYRKGENETLADDSGQFPFGDEKLQELREEDVNLLRNYPQHQTNGHSVIFKESMGRKPDD